MVDYALQGGFAGVGIKPEATVGDPAMAFDMGGPDHQERGAGIRQHAQMGHVPVVGDAVIALYWHIGETAMRLASWRSASFIGENRALVMADHML